MDALNIASLWPASLFARKQSPSRRFYLRALAERPDVNFHQSGPGFPDWDNDASGLANIRRLMPDCDAVISYKALGGCEFGRVNDPAEVARHYVTVEQLNECHPGFPGGGGAMHPGGGTAAQECIKAHLTLAIIHHENDRPRMQAAADHGIKIVHIPHCAHPMFAEEARPWSERSGVVLTGVLNAQHYPLRQRWAALIASGTIPGKQYRRPGNYTTSVEESDRLVREYAAVLGSARVKLGCSSVWKYGLQHQSEAALSGVAHVCDMPDAVPEHYIRMMHAVSPDATDAELVSAVEYALEHAEEIGTAAQAVARECYTTEHYAEQLVREIRECL